VYHELQGGKIVATADFLRELEQAYKHGGDHVQMGEPMLLDEYQ
jgi:hypothetical protein